jgi:hypothetical protein
MERLETFGASVLFGRTFKRVHWFGWDNEERVLHFPLNPQIPSDLRRQNSETDIPQLANLRAASQLFFSDHG